MLQLQIALFAIVMIASAVADEDVKKTEKRGIYSTGLGYSGGLGYGAYGGGLGAGLGYSSGLYGGAGLGYGGAGLYSPSVYSSPLYSGYSSVSVRKIN